MLWNVMRIMPCISILCIYTCTHIQYNIYIYKYVYIIYVTCTYSELFWRSSMRCDVLMRWCGTIYRRAMQSKPYLYNIYHIYHIMRRTRVLCDVMFCLSLWFMAINLCMCMEIMYVRMCGCINVSVNIRRSCKHSRSSYLHLDVSCRSSTLAQHSFKDMKTYA